MTAVPRNSAPTLLTDQPGNDAADNEPIVADTRGPWRRGFVLVLKLALAVALVVWLDQTGQLELGALVRLRPSSALAMLLLLTLLSLGLPVWRWWWLLRIQGLPVSLFTALRLSWLGYLCALFLPGAMSGDAVKAVLIVRGQPTGRFRALSTVIVDRLLGLYSLLFLGAVPLAWWWYEDCLTSGALALGYTTLLLWIGGTAAILLVTFAPTRRLSIRLLPSRWREAIDGSWLSYAQNPGPLAGCFLISLAIDVAAVASFAVAADALDLVISWGATFLAGPLAVMANGIPITPGGAGVGEVASSQLFRTLGVTWGAESMLLVRVVSLLVTLPAALVGWHRAAPATVVASSQP